MPHKFKHDDYPLMSFKTARSFDIWLAKNHAKSEGVWVKMARKASGIKSVMPTDALEIVLCHGWIDGLRRSLDEHHYLQKYTPRRKNSNWSEINKAKANELIKAGRMKEGGFASIEMAKKNGRWEGGT